MPPGRSLVRSRAARARPDPYTSFIRNPNLSTAESMTDVKAEAELENSPCRPQPFVSGLQEDMSRERQTDCELDEPLSPLVNVALAPHHGEHAACSCDCESLQSMQLQLQFLMSKADDLHNCLGHLDQDALAAAVLSFLFTCQPFFNHLESTARSAESQYNRLSYDSCTGIQLGQLRLTAFRYCKPTPYLAMVNTGLYKRMRWNVEMLGDKQQQQQQAEEELGGESEEREAEAARDTEYYFLCYEDIPNVYAKADADSQGIAHSNMVRMWSIGQWMQQQKKEHGEVSRPLNFPELGASVHSAMKACSMMPRSMERPQSRSDTTHTRATVTSKATLPDLPASQPSTHNIPSSPPAAQLPPRSHSRATTSPWITTTFTTPHYSTINFVCLAGPDESVPCDNHSWAVSNLPVFGLWRELHTGGRTVMSTDCGAED
ncbi:hypothetical protein INR49_023507 [Caranx melampygus]|nr:hypothetical protein INR49_023507 [Caranx melampygus]